jgi:hypothetical protein
VQSPGGGNGWAWEAGEVCSTKALRRGVVAPLIIEREVGPFSRRAVESAESGRGYFANFRDAGWAYPQTESPPLLMRAAPLSLVHTQVKGANRITLAITVTRPEQRRFS